MTDIDVKSQAPSERREPLLIVMILALALLHGLMYVFLLPPWQHYDEPKHFEYAWLAAQFDEIPAEAEIPPKFSRQVLKSMIENGFYAQMSAPAPVIGPPSQKVSIPGFSQLTEPPLYYYFAGLPIRVISSMGIDAQLYAGRLSSLVFLVLTVLAAWGTASELVSKGHPLRWMLPMTLALTPAFVENMSSVNNDSLAIAAAALLIWMSARLIRRGFSWLTFSLFALTAILTWFAKTTALVALAATIPALLFSLARGRMRRAAWFVLALSVGAGLVFSLRWDDAFAWYRNTPQAAALRVKTDQAPVGEYALQVEAGLPIHPSYLPEAYQHLPASFLEKLAGKPITFGYWVWSDQKTRLRGPGLRTTQENLSEQLFVSPEPTFYAFQSVLPEAGGRVWVDLAPELEQPGINVYYDGLLLVEGHRPISEPPSFDSGDGESGEWGGEPFINLLRNPSGEAPGPRLNPVIDNFIADWLPEKVHPSLLLGSLVDTGGTRDLYPISARHLFQTFWARFGWGHVPPLEPVWAYRLLLGFTLLGILGALLGAVRCWRTLPWDVIATFGLVVILATFLVLTRGGPNIIDAAYYFPTARYIYPAVIPVLLLLVSGWLENFRLVHGTWLRLTHKERSTVQGDSQLAGFYLAYLAFFLTIDFLSILGVAQYYGS